MILGGHGGGLGGGAGSGLGGRLGGETSGVYADSNWVHERVNTEAIILGFVVLAPAALAREPGEHKRH